MKNTNLYKVLAKLDAVISTITEDPTTTTVIAPINYDDYDFNLEDSGGDGGSSGGSNGDIPITNNLWGDIIDK